MSNTTDRIYADLLASDEKGLMEYGVTVDRSDYSHADWLREAYEETLDKAKYLRRSLDTIGAGIGGSAERKAVDVLLQIDASINTNLGSDSTVDERVAFKTVSNLILQKCRELDPNRFAIKDRPQGF